MFRATISIAAAILIVSCAAGDSPGEPAVSPASSTTSSSSPTTSSTSTSTSTSTTTSTTQPATDRISTATLVELAGRGPHPVGVTTIMSDDLVIEVWYPADDVDEKREDTYDIRDFVPALIKDLLSGDVDATFTYAAARDAAPVVQAGTPLVLFSHGFTGMRLQSATLTSHLASWGMVVAAPDHRSRDLMNVLAGTASGDANESVDELVAARSAVLSDVRFAQVDAKAWSAVGHSAGGGTVVRLGSSGASEGLTGTVVLAAGLPDGIAAVGVPTMFVAGAVDAVVPATASAAAFDNAPSGSVLWVVDGAGHNAFDDFCRFGDGAGIIGVAEASGLGPLLDAQPQLRTLGTDGCRAPAAPVTESDVAVRAGVTAYLANLQGRRAFDSAESPPGDLAVAVSG